MRSNRALRAAAGVTGGCLAVVGTLWVGVLGAAPAWAASSCQFTTHGSTMTLNGNCVTTQTITVPGGTTLNGGGHTITASDPMGSQFVGPVVVSGGSTMNVEKLTVAGHFTNATCNPTVVGPFSPALLRGVELVNASGIVKDVTVTGINKGAGNTCNEGNGIVANDETGGPYTVTIEHDVVTGYQARGILVDGHATATIAHNTVTGLAATGSNDSGGIGLVDARGGSISHNTVSTASTAFAGVEVETTNGVAVSHDTVTSPGSAQGIFESALSGGSISHETVKTGASAFAAINLDQATGVALSHNVVVATGGTQGIYENEGSGGAVSNNQITTGASSFAAVNLNETSGVTVSHNTTKGALVVYSDCVVKPNASNNTLDNNKVRGAAFGVQITADSNGSSTCASKANHNTVSHNTISDPGGTVGINVFVTTGGPFVAQADHNVLESNTITGYSNPIGNGGTHTVISGNRT